MSHYNFPDEIFLSKLFFFSLKFYFILFGVRECCRGSGRIQKDIKMNGIKIHEVKTTKNKLNVVFLTRDKYERIKLNSSNT